MAITGRTGILAVVGHPIDGARAPAALGSFVAQLGIDLAVVPADVDAAALPAFLEGARAWQNLAGLLITMPHKIAIAGLVDELTVRASTSGAVNLVRRDRDGTLCGDQVDGAGFVRSLIDAEVDVTGVAVVLFGAGGVGRSIAFALAEAGVARIVVVNRSAARAVALTDDLRHAHPEVEIQIGIETDAAAADLLVNATSLGSDRQPGIPLDPAYIRRGSVVADVIAAPQTTQLLHEAARRGARIHPGVRMQQAQFQTILAFVGAETDRPEGGRIADAGRGR